MGLESKKIRLLVDAVVDQNNPTRCSRDCPHEYGEGCYVFFRGVSCKDTQELVRCPECIMAEVEGEKLQEVGNA